jgi:hypothetical protein
MWEDYKKNRDILDKVRIEFAITEMFNRRSKAGSQNLQIINGVQTGTRNQGRLLKKLLDI